MNKRSGERESAAVPIRKAKASREAAPEAASVGTVFALQRTLGNAAVVRLLQRDPVAAATAKKTVRYGSQGDDVLYLQSRLNRAPEVTTHLAVDGAFGPKTQAAVREFQGAHPPLEVDGIVGRETWPVVEAVADEPADDMPIARKLFFRGATAYEAGDYAPAYDFFTRAQEREYRPSLVFARAQSLRRLGGRREEAIALYEEYLATGDPARKADAEAALAEVRGPAKAGDEAVDQDAARTAFNKGAALYAAGRYGHAYDEFTKAHELSPRPTVLFSRAQALRRLGARREEAIALFEEYLTTPDPSRKADAEGALLELRPAKTGDETIDTAAARAMYMKGAAYYNARQFAQAYDEFTKAHELAPRPAVAFSRAQALRKLGGRRDDAIAIYEEYIDMPGATRKAEAEFWLAELKHSGGAP